ncbi:hypothetical protein BKA58DRAFT_119073 [Alternaria rosae]|uniref:uncharacterized protein n=1 Tax=Alternaria rosae TaxID=1187941 RepID=UPI001E8D3558|nr:uncharacterized protein BKA58DRAFT_119073 [Alternaria rosae]KAH6875317.1 hypothetical protein BKA58DRAFT_119073 [Alternaria rosae]
MNNSHTNFTQYHTWKAEPLTRGTFSILYTCVLTLVLCVWTAIHLNIPEYGKAADQFWRKTGWVIIALFAPEMVVVTAYCQYKEATKLGIYMRDQLGQEPPPKVLNRLRKKLRNVARHLFSKERQHEPISESKRPPHAWTDTHSLFAIMGGFVIDLGDKDIRISDHATRLALSVHSIKFIAKYAPETFSRISQSAIQDKSKANTVVKFLACFQASWFCAQCINRAAGGLSVSLLELNTAVHTVCALTLYLFLWWDKPLDVEEGIVLQGEDLDRLAAFLAMANRFPHARLRVAKPSRHSGINAGLSQDQISTISLDSPQDTSLAGMTLEHFGEFDMLAYHSRQDIGVSELCLTLAFEAANKFEFSGVHKEIKPKLYDILNNCQVGFQGYSRIIYLNRVQNRPTWEQLGPKKVHGEVHQMESERNILTSVLTYSSILASLFYGGAHLLAWDRAFRTPTEQILWRISGITIGVFGFVSMVGASLVSTMEARWYSITDELGPRRRAGPFDRPEATSEDDHDCPSIRELELRRKRQRKTHLKESLGRGLFVGFDALSTLLLCLALLFYMLCRIFIIVECFIDLFHLPDSAFIVPMWSLYFPHLS